MLLNGHYKVWKLYLNFIVFYQYQLISDKFSLKIISYVTTVLIAENKQYH